MVCSPSESDLSAAPFASPAATMLFWVDLWDKIACPWWRFRTKGPLQERRIPGRNDGKLTSLLYPIVLPGCM